MRRFVPFVLCAALTLAACSTISNSSLNPVNWFGSSTVEATAAAIDPATGQIRPLVQVGGSAAPIDDRVLVPDITGLVIEQTADGAIIRATGIAPTQGYYNAHLVRVSFVDGVLTYELRANDPVGTEPTGSVASRTLNVATSVAGATLDAVRTVRVVGQATTRVVSR